MTNPATVIKRVGLPADAQLAAFFAVPFIKCNLDLKLIRHLPGPSHLDNFAWTRNLPSIYRDWQKTRQPLTDGNSPYHRAVIKNTRRGKTIRLPALQVIKYTLIRNLFAVYQFVPRRSTCTFKLFVLGDNSCCPDNFRSQPHKPANALIKNWLPATLC